MLNDFKVTANLGGCCLFMIKLTLTHLLLVPNICVSKHAGLLLIGFMGTNCSEIFKEMHFNMSSAKMVRILSRGRWVNWKESRIRLWNMIHDTSSRKGRLTTYHRYLRLIRTFVRKCIHAYDNIYIYICNPGRKNFDFFFFCGLIRVLIFVWFIPELLH